MTGTERKVFQKYYPPDFDPAKIPRAKGQRNRQFVQRVMAPYNMQCNTCHEYIYKGKKFNMRRETAEGELYLGLKIFRFYFRCPNCLAEITFKTDLENCDYAQEHGATRLFEAFKLYQQEEKAKETQEEEDKKDPMKMLEKRTQMSRTEMEAMGKIEELQEINRRHEAFNPEQYLESGRLSQADELQRQEERDEQFVRSLYGRTSDGKVIKRILDDDEEDDKLIASLHKFRSHISTMGRFHGKVALITGASGGIGRATAVLFAREGARLTITGRNSVNLNKTRNECIQSGAKERDVLELLGDVTLESVQNELIAETVQRFGKLDILVNIHGGGEVERNEDGDLRLSVYDTVMNTNFKSKYILALKAMPHLKQSHGDIVNVSSISSRIADPQLPFYSLASTCVDHATKLLALEHASSGVRVNTVNPSVVDTAVFEKFGIPKQQATKLKQHIARTSIPQGEVAKPENIAEIIAFLADRSASKCITGQSIAADGGAMLKVAMADYDSRDVFRALHS